MSDGVDSGVNTADNSESSDRLGANIAPARTRAMSWSAFGSIYAPAFMLALGTGIALPAIPTIAKSFHVSFGLASSLVTVYLVGGLVGTVPSGWLVDRFGRRKVTIAGPLITAATGLMIATAHTFPELVIYRFIGGFAAQMWLIGRLAAISHGAAANQRGRQVSWMYGMDNSGKIFGPLIGSVLATAWGARAPFVAYGFLALTALVTAILFVHDPPELIGRRAGDGTRGKQRSILPARYIVRSRSVYFGVALLASLTRGPVQADLLQVYAAFAYHLGPQGVGFLSAAGAGVYVPIALAAGVAMDSLGRKRSMVPGFAGVAVMMTALSLSAFAHLSLEWFVVLFLLQMIMQGFTGGSIQTIGADVAPAQARGVFLGLWRLTGQSGMTLGPIVFSMLAQLAYGASFIFTATTATTVTFLLVRFVPETRDGGEGNEVLERYQRNDLLRAQQVAQRRAAKVQGLLGRVTDPEVGAPSSPEPE